VRARTFHSAALAQLRHFAPGEVGRILSSKALMLRQIANGLPRAYRFRPAGDLATEIEWAKNRRIAPSGYLAALEGREPPIPPDLMLKVYRAYEERKAAAGAIDFEDLLERTVRLYEADEAALAELRSRYRAFTVDEYQDVNLLQQALLEHWLGERDDLCVVGDDYQSIYGFTGASAAHLLALRARGQVFRLEENYRSTPQVLALANRLVPRLGGAEKQLRADGADGPEPELRGLGDPGEEGAFVVERIRALHRDGVALEEIAVLFRTNARSADYEEVLHGARIPFQGASLLARDAARGLQKRLRGAGGPAAEAVERSARELGWLEEPPDGLGEREQTRQNDLARLVALAHELGEADVGEFLAELEARFGASVGSGVHLLTLHRAKGLEWDAVFLPRVEEGELPIRRGDPDEERRLLYVGLTRARRHLTLTWSGKPSRFLGELGVERAAPPKRKPAESDSPVVAALKAWRLARSRADEVPAYVVFHNTTLEEIAARQPSTLHELAAVPGVGPAKLERYGPEVLAALAGG
jgi:DNA helicase-2/ATP-dependent DNA helicase PcrA